MGNEDSSVRQSLTNLRMWVVRFLQWLNEVIIEIECGLFVFVAGIISFYIYPSEGLIRWTGTIFQVIGIILAIGGLLKIRTHFDLDPLKDIFVTWLKQFPKWKKNIFIGVGSGTLKAFGGSAEVCVSISKDPSLSSKKRIEAIEKHLKRMREEINDLSTSIDTLKGGYEEHKNEVTAKIKSLKDEIHSDRKALHASDLTPAMLALAMLLVGTVMSNMANGLFKLVSMAGWA